MATVPVPSTNENRSEARAGFRRVGQTLGKIFGEEQTFSSRGRELFYVPNGDGSDVVLDNIDQAVALSNTATLSLNATSAASSVVAAPSAWASESRERSVMGGPAAAWAHPILWWPYKRSCGAEACRSRRAMSIEIKRAIP